MIYSGAFLTHNVCNSKLSKFAWWRCTCTPPPNSLWLHLWLYDASI